MSQSEPKATEAANGADKAKRGKGAGKARRDKGSHSPTVTNSGGFVVPARPGLNGGLLATGGNKGMPNPNAGRPAEKVRRDATDSLAEHVGKLGSMLGKTLAAAESALDSGKLHDAMAMLNQASRAASTLTSIGPGTKVTNVVEAPELFDVFDQAMSDEGIPNDLALRVMARVKAWKDGT